MLCINIVIGFSLLSRFDTSSERSDQWWKEQLQDKEQKLKSEYDKRYFFIIIDKELYWKSVEVLIKIRVTLGCCNQVTSLSYSLSSKLQKRIFGDRCSDNFSHFKCIYSRSFSFKLISFAIKTHRPQRCLKDFVQQKKICLSTAKSVAFS